MSAEHLVLHLLAVLHGLLASLLAFAVFSLAGYGVLPRRWHETLGRGGHPAAIGAALFVLLCWYGIQLRIPLSILTGVFACASLILGTRARARITAVWRERQQRLAVAGWAGLFAGLYVLAYVLTLPPVGDAFLPIKWSGNIDLLIYLDCTSYLLRLGPPQPLSLYLASKDFVYLGTPALYHLLGGFSSVYGFDVLRAAMPAQFAFAALTGLVMARVARHAFGATALAAAVIAAAAVSGPFFRYIAGNYYLSTLMAMPVMLHLLLATVARRPARGGLDLPFAAACAAHGLLLLLVYPFMLFIALVFGGAAVVFSAFARLQDGRAAGEASYAPAVREGRQTALGLLVGLATVVALVPGETLHEIRLIRDFTKTGVWGWPMDVISPLALLGVPQSTAHLEVVGSLSSWAIASLWVIGLVLLTPFFWRFRGRTTVGERVFAALGACGFFGYAAYYAVVGASYQQWKMASYIVLPLSFVVLAGLLRVLSVHGARLLLAAHPEAARRMAILVPVLAGLALVGGNLVAHAAQDLPLRRFPGEMRNLARIDGMASFRDVAIAARDRQTGMLAAYYLPAKRVHILGPQYYPAVSFDDVSAARPLLLPDYSCDGIGHEATQAIEGVGCLLFAPPSLAPETVYPFSRTYLFITPSGLGPREGWGRWNDGQEVRLTLRADRRRVRLDADARYLNLSLQPYRVPGLNGQRVRVTWGAGRQAEVRLDEPGWVSLPLEEQDWSGEWLAQQAVSLELLDALAAQSAGSGARPLAAGFLALSVTARPIGQVSGVVSPRRGAQ